MHAHRHRCVVIVRQSSARKLHAAMTGRRECVGMDAHISRVVRAMAAWLSCFPLYTQYNASENVAVFATPNSCVQFICFLSFIHLATQQLAAGVNRRLVTNKWHQSLKIERTLHRRQ